MVALQAISYYDLYLSRERLTVDWSNAGGVTVPSLDPQDEPGTRWDFDHLGQDINDLIDQTGLGGLVKP